MKPKKESTRKEIPQQMRVFGVPCDSTGEQGLEVHIPQKINENTGCV